MGGLKRVGVGYPCRLEGLELEAPFQSLAIVAESPFAVVHEAGGLLGQA